MDRIYDWANEREQTGTVTLTVHTAKAIATMLEIAKPSLPSPQTADEAIQILRGGGR